MKAAAETFFPSALQGEVSAEKISKAIREFYFEQPVYTIRVFGEAAEKGVWLTLDVDVRPVISDVELKGHRDLKKRDLLSQVDLSRGDRAFPAHLERIQKRLNDYTLFRGFPRAVVRVELMKGKDPREGTLKITVQEGEACRISEVQVTSASEAFSPERGRKLLRVSEGERCDGREISEGARRIEAALRSEGRLSAKVSDPELSYSEDRLKARVSVNVVPGPRIAVRFRGNTFSFERDTRLKKAIFFDDERQFNPGWIESTAKEGIKQFYAAEGYPYAKIEVIDETDEGRDLHSIRFDIDRGPRVRIGKLVFRGNKKISSEDLEDQFWAVAPAATRDRVFVRDELTSISDGLLAFYQQRGFLKAKLSPPAVTMRSKENKADIAVEIEEGTPSILENFKVTGNREIETKTIKGLLKISRGEAIDPVLIRQGTDRLEEKYRAAGYKFAKVRLPAVDEVPEGKIEYPVAVEEGPKVKIGEVRVRGNLHTKEVVVRRELTFEKGDPYDPEKIKETRRKLLRLGFFESVAIDELSYDPQSGTEDVLVTVSERKKRSVAFRPGFSTDQGYRGAVEFGYVNIAGTGRSATVSGRVSRQFHDPDIIEHRAVFTYLEPHLFNLFDGRVHFIDERSEEQQFDIQRRSFILGVERNVLRWLRTALQWELEFRNPFNEQPGAVLSPIDQERARFGSIASIVDFDFRNDPLNATKGSFHRLQASFYNQSLLSDADFMQVYLRDSFYIPIYKRIRSVLSVRTGFSATYGQTKDSGIYEIPIEKRFRLGGNATMRGFGRNCVGGLGEGVAENCSDAALNQAPGGNAVFNYMFDFLLPLFSGFDLALFTDGGNAYLQDGGFNPWDIRTTAGVGIRYNTFFGPLRLDYGIKLDRRTGESFGEIHFAVGQF